MSPLRLFVYSWSVKKLGWIGGVGEGGLEREGCNVEPDHREENFEQTCS